MYQGYSVIPSFFQFTQFVLSYFDSTIHTHITLTSTSAPQISTHIFDCIPLQRVRVNPRTITLVVRQDSAPLQLARRELDPLPRRHQDITFTYNNNNNNSSSSSSNIIIITIMLPTAVEDTMQDNRGIMLVWEIYTWGQVQGKHQQARHLFYRPDFSGPFSLLSKGGAAHSGPPVRATHALRLLRKILHRYLGK
jgi:hypothetical protein